MDKTMDLVSIKLTLGTILAWAAYIITSNNIIALLTITSILVSIGYNITKWVMLFKRNKNKPNH